MPPLLAVRVFAAARDGLPLSRAVRPSNSVARRVASFALAMASMLAALTPLHAAEPLPTGPTHRGTVAAGPYQIFPENRLGNGVYLDGVLLFALPGQTILGVAQLAPRGRLIYLARSSDGKRTVGVRTLAGDAAPRTSEPAKGYEYVTAGFDGLGYKKFFRITDTSITDLLPMSRTADGLTIGQKGILFYHVGSSAAAQAAAGAPGEPPAGAYGIRLHWLNADTGAVRHLGRTIYSNAPTIKLTWLDDDQFQYTLSDGKTESLDISEFR